MDESSDTVNDEASSCSPQLSQLKDKLGDMAVRAKQKLLPQETMEITDTFRKLSIDGDPQATGAKRKLEEMDDSVDSRSPSPRRKLLSPEPPAHSGAALMDEVIYEEGGSDNNDFNDDDSVNDDEEILRNSWGFASRQMSELVLLNAEKDNTIEGLRLRLDRMHKDSEQRLLDREDELNTKEDQIRDSNETVESLRKQLSAEIASARGLKLEVEELEQRLGDMEKEKEAVEKDNKSRFSKLRDEAKMAKAMAESMTEEKEKTVKEFSVEMVRSKALIRKMEEESKKLLDSHEGIHHKYQEVRKRTKKHHTGLSKLSRGVRVIT